MFTRAIARTQFIGSPLSMQNLFNSCQSPAVNRAIHVHYDYKTCLEPVINSTLHNYQLPHVFLFTKFMVKCICKHKPYSTSPNFLPLEPIHHIDADGIENFERHFTWLRLGSIGGMEERRLLRMQ